MKIAVPLIGLLVVVATVSGLYIAQQHSTPEVAEPRSIEELLDEVAAASPFDPEETYFEEVGAPVSGAELHELYMDDVRRLLEFEFTLVPDALMLINLPEPPAQNETDLEAYQSVRAGEEPPPFAGLALVPPNYEQSYIDIIYSSQYADAISDISFELGMVIIDLAEMFDRPALHERHAGAVTRTADPLPLPLDQNARTVYPNLRAGEAFFNYEFFSRLDPEFAEVYRTDAEFHAAYGQYHGLYGQSDVNATASVVRQYFDEYEALHGPLSEQFPEISSLLHNLRSS